jgi:hypothetical protein
MSCSKKGYVAPNMLKIEMEGRDRCEN